MRRLRFPMIRSQPKSRLRKRAERAILVWLIITVAFALLLEYHLRVERRWMIQAVRFDDGTVVTVEHRSTGAFVTTVQARNGSLSHRPFAGRDSRHVNLYRSPSGTIVIADYGREPLLVSVTDGLPLVLTSRSGRKREYAMAADWRYLGAVRRTDSSELAYFPDEPECQIFVTRPDEVIDRRVVPCNDPNY